jgi:hypothetical protein
VTWSVNDGIYDITCQRCGRYQIEHAFKIRLERDRSEFEEDVPFLSAHTRQGSERHDFVTLNLSNWSELAAFHRFTTVSQKLEKLLKLFCKRSTSFGYPVVIQETDFVLIDAADQGELARLAAALKRQNALQEFGLGQYSVTPEGWLRADPVGPSGKPGTCFIARSFHPSMELAAQGMREAIKTDCGYEPIDLGSVAHNENINDRIIAEIRSAQFVVADFTGQSHGVYFEAGFAEGLGRTVIRTVQEDHAPALHFDTRQYFHLRWKAPEHFRRLLAEHIKATIGSRR